MKLSIAYITNRAEPLWGMFADSLCAQMTPEQNLDIQVIFVDGKLWSPCLSLQPHPPFEGRIALAHHFYHSAQRRFDLETAVKKRFDYLHIPPKPCTLQGPFRLTNRDFFCASNTRNTAIIAARHPYLVCVDDLSVLMPGWLAQVMHAAEHGYCVCGAYKKVKKLNFWAGAIDGIETMTYEEFPGGIDSRWAHGDIGGIVPWHGSGLYGCSFGVPTEAALAVDGFESGCNGQGGEDFDFGIRLERSGVKISYNRNMLTLESEEGHHGEPSLPRERRLVLKDRLPADYDSSPKPNEAEAYFSDHVLLNRVRNETGRVLPLFPEGLRAMRQEFLANGMVPIPTGPSEDWRDGTKLSEL